MNLKKLLRPALTATALAGMLGLASCNGTTTVIVDDTVVDTYGLYQSPYVTVDQFVDSLNYVDGTYDTFVEYYVHETLRSQVLFEDDWFVIWDANWGEHKAINLTNLRRLWYYDYMSNNDSLAAEFRAIELDDHAVGEFDGDYYGDEYEVVDWDDYYGVFVGRNSGFEYEDEEAIADVVAQAATVEQKQFYKRAAALSVKYEIGIESAMGLATLGSKMKGMIQKGELSSEDLSVLSSDLEKFTGVSVVDFVAGTQDAEKRAENIATAAKTLGTSSASFEQKLLPELLGGMEI